MVEILGRRVRVQDASGERVCFLAGQRAVVGDEVQWVPARGEGGKLVGVGPRRTVLRRMDLKGREQVLVANLEGLLVVMSASAPGFRPALLDRYLVAASAEGLQVALALSKVDLGVPDPVEEQLARRTALGLRVFRVSSASGEGVQAVGEFLSQVATRGPWVLVGGSGVGKTSLVARLLPGQEVGEVGEISAYWGTGRHTTTSSRIFALPGGGEIADSPGIRNFTPALAASDVRDHFPGLHGIPCRYRDCLHRPGEDGCVAEAQLEPALLASYRVLLSEVLEVEQSAQPWR